MPTSRQVFLSSPPRVEREHRRPAFAFAREGASLFIQRPRRASLLRFINSYQAACKYYPIKTLSAESIRRRVIFASHTEGKCITTRKAGENISIARRAE